MSTTYSQSIAESTGSGNGSGSGISTKFGSNRNHDVHAPPLGADVSLGSLPTPDHCGWLNKLSTSGFRRMSWKKRWAVVIGRRLYFFRSDQPGEMARAAVDLAAFSSVFQDPVASNSSFCFRISRAPGPAAGSAAAQLIEEKKKAARAAAIAAGLEVSDTSSDKPLPSDASIMSASSASQASQHQQQQQQQQQQQPGQKSGNVFGYVAGLFAPGIPPSAQNQSSSQQQQQAEKPKRQTPRSIGPDSGTLVSELRMITHEEVLAFTDDQETLDLWIEILQQRVSQRSSSLRRPTRPKQNGQQHGQQHGKQGGRIHRSGSESMVDPPTFHGFGSGARSDEADTRVNIVDAVLKQLESDEFQKHRAAQLMQRQFHSPQHHPQLGSGSELQRNRNHAPSIISTVSSVGEIAADIAEMSLTRYSDVYDHDQHSTISHLSQQYVGAPSTSAHANEADFDPSIDVAPYVEQASQTVSVRRMDYTDISISAQLAARSQAAAAAATTATTVATMATPATSDEPHLRHASSISSLTGRVQPLDPSSSSSSLLALSSITPHNKSRTGNPSDDHASIDQYGRSTADTMSPTSASIPVSSSLSGSGSSADSGVYLRSSSFVSKQHSFASTSTSGASHHHHHHHPHSHSHHQSHHHHHQQHLGAHGHDTSASSSFLGSDTGYVSFQSSMQSSAVTTSLSSPVSASGGMDFRGGDHYQHHYSTPQMLPAHMSLSQSSSGYSSASSSPAVNASSAARRIGSTSLPYGVSSAVGPSKRAYNIPAHHADAPALPTTPSRYNQQQHTQGSEDILATHHTHHPSHPAPPPVPPQTGFPPSSYAPISASGFLQTSVPPPATSPLGSNRYPAISTSAANISTFEPHQTKLPPKSPGPYSQQFHLYQQRPSAGTTQDSTQSSGPGNVQSPEQSHGRRLSVTLVTMPFQPAYGIEPIGPSSGTKHGSTGGLRPRRSRARINTMSSMNGGNAGSASATPTSVFTLPEYPADLPDIPTFTTQDRHL